MLLRVEGASRGWVLRYAINGKRRRMGLGAYPMVTLAAARDLAREAQQKIGVGIEPIEERGVKRAKRQLEAAKKLLFRDAARACIRSKSSEWSNPKHAAQWAATLETYAFPHIGDMDVTSIDTQHILSIL